MAELKVSGGSNNADPAASHLHTITGVAELKEGKAQAIKIMMWANLHTITGVAELKELLHRLLQRMLPPISTPSQVWPN